MLKKRLVGVIIVKDGWAVQSFQYRRYLPLGDPGRLAENLDRWGADEILVLCIDRSRQVLGPDYALVQGLGALGLSTPLTYGGGIQTAEQAARVIQLGAERVCMDAALHLDHQPIREMASQIGAQALIAALPLTAQGTDISWYDYRSGQNAPMKQDDFLLFSEGVISEALVIDWQHEGEPKGFDMRIVRNFPFPAVPLIAFGGISEPAQVADLLALTRVAAVGVGNFLNYSEHAVQEMKSRLTQLPLRPATYATEYSGYGSS